MQKAYTTGVDTEETQPRFCRHTQLYSRSWICTPLPRPRQPFYPGLYQLQSHRVSRARPDQVLEKHQGQRWFDAAEDECQRLCSSAGSRPKRASHEVYLRSGRNECNVGWGDFLVCKHGVQRCKGNRQNKGEVRVKRGENTSGWHATATRPGW